MKPILIGWAAVFAALLPCAPASAELLLQWKFDEGAGAMVADTGTGTPAPGTLVNSAWTTNTPGGSGFAVDTSGADASTLKYVTGGDVDKIDGLSQFTLTTWLNLQDIPAGNRRILAKQAATANFDGFSWNVSEAGNGATRTAANFGARLFVGGSNGFAFDPIPAENPSFVIDADNKWTFLAVSYDGTLTEDNVKYYAGSTTGAVSLLATTTVNAGTTGASDAAFAVGLTDAAPAANTSIPGFVDDARVYNTILSLEDLDLVRLENLAGTAIPGDVNGDGVVNAGDINPFIFALSNTEAAFQAQFPSGVYSHADVNGPGFAGDGFVNAADINPFIQLLSGAGEPGIAAALAAVPEPASLGLLGLGALSLLARRRA